MDMTGHTLYILSLVLTIGGIVSGNILDVTLVNFSPVASSSSDVSLYSVLGGADSSGSTSFQRSLSSSGPTETETACFVGSTNTDDCGLPPGTTIGQHPATSALSAVVQVSLEGSSNQLGAYSCTADRYNWTTEVSALVMYDEAEYKPSALTFTVSLDEEITLTMTSTSTSNSPTWLLNGQTDLSNNVTPGTDSFSLYISRARKADAGIHHVYGGNAELGGLVRLIVRGCLDNLWGPTCEYTCPTCYNGGVCDDQSGRCVCPPGFSGDHCEKSCTSGTFGKNCSSSCSSIGAADCRGGVFCLPDPYGCSCAAGWKGLTCDEACDDGTYGAACTQTCHCSAGAAACHKSTGECTGGCESGWTGDQCQVKVLSATAVNRRARVAASNFVGIFITDDQADPSVGYYIGRGVDTGPGETGHGITVVTSDVTDTGLPPGTTVVLNRQSGSDQSSLRANFDENDGGVERVGAYRMFIEYKGAREWIVMMNEYREDGDIWPDQMTTTSGVGETATLSVSATNNLDTTLLRWRHNSGDVITAWNGMTGVTINNLRRSNAGVYECYQDGNRESGLHAIMRLIVRSCPSSKWGMDCSQDCPVCYAGGVCHDVTGECVCRPGFTGPNCTTACSNNEWGKNCNVKCSSNGDCENRLLSPPDPVGISCINGFSGHDCATPCSGSTFGANCELACNCDGICDLAEGCQGTCAAGFTGAFCQVPEITSECQSGLFGTLCHYQCHCEGTGSCDRTTGECLGGEGCQPGWGGADCQQALPQLFDLPWIVDISNDSAVLAWNAWKDGFDYGTGPIDSYWLTYSWTDDVGNTGNSTEPIIIENDSAAAVGDLNGFRDYVFYLSVGRKVRGQVVTGIRSGPITFKTLCGPPLLSPDNVSAVVNGVDSITLSWQLPETPSSSWLQCNSSTYNFTIIYSSSNNQAGTIITVDGTVTNRIFDRLSPCSTYSFSLAIVNSDGLIGPSYYTEATTDTAAPDPVDLDGVSYNSTSYDELEVTWSAPTSQCEPVVYNVTRTLLLRDQCDNSYADSVDWLTTNSTTVRYDDLVAFSTYELTFLSSVDDVEANDTLVVTVETAQDVPTAAPANLASDNTIMGQLLFSWDIPSCGSRKGNISYSYTLTQYGEPSTPTSAELRETEKEFLDLPHWTWFNFTVCAMTSVGTGPCMFNRTRTLPSQPTPPRNVDIVPGSINQTFATISWTEPEFINGELLQYQITGVQEVITITEDFEDEMFYSFSDLEPGNIYNIKISATSNGGQGEEEEVGVQTLPIPTPEEPGTPEMISRDQTFIFINWTAPDEGNLGIYVIQGYDIKVSSSSGDPVKTDANTDPEPVMTFNITELRPGTEYDISVRAKNEEGPGPWSESLYERTRSNPPAPPGPEPLVIALGVSVPLLLIIILALGFVYYGRRRRNLLPVENKDDGHYLGNINEVNAYAETPLVDHEPIQVDDLALFIKTKRLSSDGFDHEYESLYNDLDETCVGCLPQNKTKNRYKNIITSDKYRVKLKNGEEAESDYINATFIDGYKKRNAYIATQGPNTASLDDFWQMVYEQKTAVIVMLTNLVEENKSKCLEYWPKPLTNAQYGNLTVMCSAEDKAHTSYTLRQFEVRNNDPDSVLKVSQYHYTIWPDKSVPWSTQPLIDFRDTVKKANPAGAGPIIVHCSAGAGRTGTFIALDSMMSMVKAEKKVDIFNFVNNMRKRRTFMVQVQQQYEFIYETLMVWSACRRVEAPLENFAETLQKWRKVDPSTGKSQIAKQFEMLESLVPTESITSDQKGFRRENMKKNRFPDKVPMDRYKPLLMTEGDSPADNDYINASFFDFEGRKNAHVCTQCPLHTTVGDFWRLVTDYECNTVVHLNAMDDSCGQYWPDRDQMTVGSFTIELLSCDKLSDSITKRVLKVTSAKKREERRVTHFQYHGWPNDIAVPRSSMDFYSFVEEVERGRKSANEKLLVVCLDGVGASPTFLATMATVGKAREEKVVDVFSAVKRLRRSRPGVVDKLKRYDFCFDVAVVQQDSLHTYANY